MSVLLVVDNPFFFKIRHLRYFLFLPPPPPKGIRLWTKSITCLVFPTLQNFRIVLGNITLFFFGLEKFSSIDWHAPKSVLYALESVDFIPKGILLGQRFSKCCCRLYNAVYYGAPNGT